MYYFVMPKNNPRTNQSKCISSAKLNLRIDCAQTEKKHVKRMTSRIVHAWNRVVPKSKKKKTKKIPSKYSDYVHSFDQCSFEWTNTIFDSLLVLYKKEMALLCVHTNYNKLYRYNINSTHAKLTKAVTKFFIFLFIIKLRDKFSF